MIQLQPTPTKTTRFLILEKGSEQYYFFYDDADRH